MKNEEISTFEPLPDKAEIDYGSFRARLLKVETTGDEKKRSVTMNYVNVRTGEAFSRGYSTTDTPGKFAWSGDEMGGETNVTAVISGLDRLAENVGAEAVQKLKEFLGLVSDKREELEVTLMRR